MATIQICDRCRHPADQLEAVRSKELCPACVALLDLWIDPLPLVVRAPNGRVLNRLDQAKHFIARHGVVSANMISELNGEEYRTAYYALRHLERTGVLRNTGDGIFVLAESRTAQAAE